MRFFRFVAFAIGWAVAIVAVAWAFGALYFDFPRIGALAAILFVVILLAIVIFVRGKLLKLAIVFGAFAAVVSWWLTLMPSIDRVWQLVVVQIALSDINGDNVPYNTVRK